MQSEAEFLEIRVTPKAAAPRIVLSGTTVKVYVCAPPEGGQANRAVCELLAKALAVSKSKVQIVRGLTSRGKHVQIEGLSPKDAIVKLAEIADVRPLPGLD